MKTFINFINESSDSSSSKDGLIELLAKLEALKLNYKANHWNASGDKSYGNHLLFQRLYEAMDADIDSLAEKITAYYGSGSISALDVSNRMLDCVKEINPKNPINSSIIAEESLQEYLKSVYERMKENKEMTLGLDDFIMALANKHETNIYLLKQAKK